MTAPDSGIREPSPPDRLPEVSETAKPLDTSPNDLCRYVKPGMVR